MPRKFSTLAQCAAAILAVLLADPVGAQERGGLAGPSSVAADLQPGDGLTDPQFRSDFPRNVAPGIGYSCPIGSHL